ncbi:MAG: hypothetical protein AAGA35_02960 [Patescibacteria group bacterium]
MHRDGQNEYSINGSKVRLKDVQELLAAANIGSTGHHIISQGEADRILSANAKERREMIEDALGLKVFQYKKQEAEKKLERTNKNIEQVQSLRREVAPHLKYLERQVKKIEKSLELQKELKSFYAEYLKREDTYIAHHGDRLKRERNQPESQLAVIEEKLVTAKELLEKADDSTQKDELLKAEAALRETTKERQAVTRQVGQLEGQVTFLQRRITEAERRREQLQGAPVAFSEVERLVKLIESEVEKSQPVSAVDGLQRTLKNIAHTARVFLQRASETESDDSSGLVGDKQELQELESQYETLQQQFSTAEEREQAAQTTYRELQQAIESEASESREAERAVFQLVNEKRDVESQLEKIDRELDVLERDRHEFKRELQEAVALIGSAASNYFSYQLLHEGTEVTNEMMVAEDRSVQRERRHSLEKMKIRLEELGIGATDEIVKEYNDTKERDAFLEREISDLEQSVQKLDSLIGELTEQLNKQFLSGIDKIATEFNRFFMLMFGGGEAGLKKVSVKKKKVEIDEETGEPVEHDEEGEQPEEGIELEVKLPNKRVKGLEMLSGGERALTSIALIFAMSQVNPPLFIILDETDAALDEANSRRYGDMIEALAKKSQLILITHNRETMSRAGILYGITMGGDGISKLLSVKFDEAAAVAK